MYTRTLAFGAALILVAGTAQAGITESEPNNSFGTADVIARGAAPWADTGLMSLRAGASGDLDFFAISLSAGEVITIITTPLDPPFDNPDTMLGFFDSDGILLDFNDDANGLGSAIRYQVDTDGTYYIGVTGFADFDFVGDHGQVGIYSLTVAVKFIPAPGALALLGMGLVGARRRRSA